MELYRYLEKQENPTVVALGFFDGMHLGHQKIVSKTVEYSKNNNLTACLFTFLQSPRSVIENHEVELLMTNEQKLAAIQEMGINITYMIDFNDIKEKSPKEFVRDVLCDILNAKLVVCGFNYNFGSGGYAGAEDLKMLCKDYRIGVYVEEPVTYQNEPISSTRIRNAIKNGEFTIAQSMLS